MPTKMATPDPAIEEEYRFRLRSHLSSLLLRGPLDFCEIVGRSDGAFPVDVHRSLQDLICRNEIRQEAQRYIYQGNVGRQGCVSVASIPNVLEPLEERSVKDSGDRADVLADPHPADYDWRFSSNTVSVLLPELDAVSRAGGRIALLGVPTLYLALAKLGANVHLFDKSRSLLNDLSKAGFTQNLQVHDLTSTFSEEFGRFDVVFADPPWYPEFYRAFILRASEILNEGGMLLLSVLPWLTRPSATSDRVDLHNCCEELGFHLMQSIPRLLNYETPPFEQMSLLQHELECGNWRRGDLHEFRYMPTLNPNLTGESIVSEPEWEEFRVGALKVKLRIRSDKTERCFSARPVMEGNMFLDTVSRRSPLRSSIDLWTSRNYALAVEGLDVLRAALGELERGQEPARIVEHLAVTLSLEIRDCERLQRVMEEILEQSGAK